jgi:hypothetical protein
LLHAERRARPHFTPLFQFALLLVIPGALLILLAALLWTGQDVIGWPRSFPRPGRSRRPVSPRRQRADKPGRWAPAGDLEVEERALVDTLRPMTSEQAEMLKRLAKAAYELDVFKPPNLTRTEADRRIAALAAKLKLLGEPPHTL